MVKERKEWKRPVVVMLNDEDITIIDDLREGTPRSEYVRNIIKEFIVNNG